ncbi:PEP-CTERM sorting domain-containing protein [Cephaloticoccus primus]|uniref:PEP-CTERM sorting domain-containing protein n=1 Tax=Cephaloticoccus primus TaxID=1548207 RepID=UPI0018D36CB3|nr:PEP-CTERM sorting domain-containing protein [Cephaloticoccus primus]
MADPGLFPIVDLNGHTITLNSKGIEIVANTRSAFLTGGIITSGTNFVNARFTTHPGKVYNNIYISSVIADSDHKVGLRVTGNDAQDAGFHLKGDQSNTFTGRVEVSGQRKHLVLAKTNGAIAIRGDVFVQKRARIRFLNSNQLLKTSNISLKSYGELQYLSNENTTNIFRNLTIEDNGIVNFIHRDRDSQKSKYYIKVDNLIINKDGHLQVQGWQEGRDFLLVRKDSTALRDALTKVSFAGYNSGNIHLEDYDSEYWSISAAPEPAMYGALFGAAGIGLWGWRKRRCRGRKTQHQMQRRL